MEKSRPIRDGIRSVRRRTRLARKLSQRRIKSLGLPFAGWVALAILFLGLSVWMIVAVRQADDASDGSVANVGDAFGGTIGPILSFAALFATIVLAALVQPRREAKARNDRSDEKTKDEARALKAREDERAALRAEKVVAWMAETYAEFTADGACPVDEVQLGVVVANTSGSVVFSMDFLPDEVANEAAIMKKNREALVPPGTWFFTLTGDSADSAGELGWQKPVPIDVSGIPTVTFQDTHAQDALTGTTPVSMRTLGVRPHLPTRGSTHYRLKEIRYTLHDTVWARDATGKVSGPDPWTAEEESEFARAEAVDRPSATTERDTATLVRMTMAKICGNADAYEQKYTQFPANGAYLQRVHAVSRNRATGLYLHLTEASDGPLIRIAGNRSGAYPEMAQYYLSSEPGKVAPMLPKDFVAETTDRLNAVLAAKFVHGIPPEASAWFSGADLSPEWKELLQTLVDTAHAHHVAPVA